MCFSSLSRSLEGENLSFPWHRQLGKKPLPVLVPGMVQQKVCGSARSSPGAGCSPVCLHHLLWVLLHTRGSATLLGKMMLQLLLAISIFSVVSQIIKDSFCVLWGGLKNNQKATALFLAHLLLAVLCSRHKTPVAL